MLEKSAKSGEEGNFACATGQVTSPKDSVAKMISSWTMIALEIAFYSFHLGRWAETVSDLSSE